MGPLTYLQGNGRALVGAWLAACLLGVGALAWLGTTASADRAIEIWNERWLDRLEQDETLVEAGELERAADYLERLDADFPALLGKHRFGYARVRLLELLGRTQAELGRKRRALDALERLVDFDPRGWPGYFQLAETCRRFGETSKAARAYREVLAIHPSHLPTVEALIGMAYDAGSYAEVPPLYEAYLDAFLVGRIVVRVGERAAMLGLAIDGREHRVEVSFDPPAEPRARVCIETCGFSVRLSELELVPPRRAGAVAWSDPLVLAGGPGWEALGGRVLPDGSLAAEGPGSALCRTIAPTTVGRARLSIRAFKAVGPELWERVEKSYRNALQLEALERARERTRIGGCLLAGSELGTPDGALIAWTERCDRLLEERAGPEALAQLLDRAPDPFTALPLLPKSMIVRMRFDEARRAAFERLARDLTAAGDGAGAVSALERLVALEPDDWRHHWSLTQAARAAGLDARALEACRAVLALRPDHAEARAALEAGR